MRLLFLSLLCLLPLHAQTANPEESIRFLSVTSFQEPADSKNYAYLTWQAQSSEALFDHNHAVFHKSGPAASPNLFVRSGTMSFQTQLNIVSALLDSTPPSLFDAAVIEPIIDDLFGDLVASPSLTLAGKISGVLQAAKRDPRVFRRLIFLSRTQPVLGLCMGTAAVVPVNGVVTTFELRTLPAGTLVLNAQPGVVAGRVTLDLASPPIIPPPGRPIHVLDLSASGHLNAKLRWGVPSGLRQRTPLTYGFNVYRMTRAFAEGANYHITPPASTALTGLLSSDPNDVRLVNQLPLMPTKLMTVVEAADLVGDPETYFTVDDNGVLLDGGAPMGDGDEFYYFASARDLLGRPGAISPGTLVTICDRHRPLAPSRVKAVHKHVNTAAPSDFIEVSWEKPTSGDTPDFYFVYRWANPEEMIRADEVAEYSTHQIAGPIPHDPATTRYRIRDNGASAPSVPANLGETWWYSVRAVKNTACGPLTGPNSAPGWGVLRDWKGPNSGDASLTITRFCPTFSLESATIQQLNEQIAAEFTGPINGTHYYHLKILRVDPRIKAAKIYLCAGIDEKDGGETVTSLLGQKVYSKEDELLDVKYCFPSAVFQLRDAGLILCAVDQNGKEAYKKIGFDELPTLDPPSTYAEICFCVEEEEQTTVIGGGGVGSGNTHTSVDPGTGGINPTEITFTPTAGTKEYKLYKRIDGGPLLLIGQAEYDGAPSVTIEDAELPANATEMCYFLQYFDEHGNPSPLADLGCLLTTTKVEMPVPIMAEVRKAGTQAAPQGVIRWFCQPEGVERFRIYICDGDTGVKTTYSSELQTPSVAIVPFGGGAPAFGFPTLGRPFGSGGGSPQGFLAFETGRLGGNFHDTGTAGEYSLPLDLATGRDYKIYVESVSAAGDRSSASNIVNFTWSQSNVVGPEVPWPARSLPALDPDFIPEIEAEYAYNSREGRYYAAVQIGELQIDSEKRDVTLGSLTTDNDNLYVIPSSWPDTDEYNLILYKSSGGETALDFALYRYQVPNLYFPTVSGDLVQVSPLINRVRTGPYLTTHEGLYDPFLELLENPQALPLYGLYVKDTQGAVRGARYVYVLVRFKENGEIDRCIPTNELEIPLVDPTP
jgi:hypothetical protein